LKNNKIKRMAGIALLMAMVVVMQFLGGMIPPVGGFSISLVLIPIVLGAAVFGPKAGAILGGTFSVVVIINCITGADAGGAMVFQANPILCILVVMAKGILAGLASGVIYAAVKGYNGYMAMILAAIVAPVVNTGVFVVCMYLFFIDILAAWAGGGNVLGYILTGLILANFVPELIINVVFSPAGNLICKNVTK
jgi:uncharacterized membrane protein